MEFTRIVDAQSKESNNGMPSIVEAGALAVATTVEHHSLTSKCDITSPNNESFHYEEGEKSLIEPMPLFPQIPKRPSSGNTNIQDIWIKSVVMMVLVATSGFLMWNGKKWIPLNKRNDSNRISERRPKKHSERRRHSSSSEMSCEECAEKLKELRSKLLAVDCSAESVFLKFEDKYIKLIKLCKEKIGKSEKSRSDHRSCVLNEYSRLLDTFGYLTNDKKSPPLPELSAFFVELLRAIERIWVQLRISWKNIQWNDHPESDLFNPDFKRDVLKITYEHMEKFLKPLKHHPKAFKDCDSEYASDTDMAVAYHMREELSAKFMEVRSVIYKFLTKMFVRMFSVEEFMSLFDTFREVMKFASGEKRSDIFMEHLQEIDVIWELLGISLEEIERDKYSNGAKTEVVNATYRFMKEISKQDPEIEKILKGRSPFKTRRVRKLWRQRESLNML